MNTSIARIIAYQPTRGRLAPIRTPLAKLAKQGARPRFGAEKQRI